MEQDPSARSGGHHNHESLFGPWRPLIEVERGSVNPDDIAYSGREIKIPMIPTRIYGPDPNIPPNIPGFGPFNAKRP